MNFLGTTPPAARIFWTAGLALLAGLLALYAVGFVAILLEGQVAAWQALIFPTTTGAMLWILLRGEKKSPLPAAGLFGILMAAVVAALATSAPFHDFSWDGMTSHSLKVRWMALGFPPAEAPKLNFGHVISAYAFQITGIWNAGKAVNLLLAAVCFCLTTASLQTSGSRFPRALALLSALNPVTIYQLSSYQVDGQVASLLTSLIFCLGAVLTNSHFLRPAALAVGLLSLALVTAKNSGIFFGGLVLAVFSVAMALRTQSLRPLLLVGAGLFFFAVLFGFVLRKTMNFGLLSLEYVQSATSPSGYGYGYTPGGGASQIEEFGQSSKLKQFLASNFSYTEIAPTGINWKPPFWMIRREIRVFEELTPDPRAGGFGPLYGTALLLGWGGLFAGLLAKTLRPTWPDWFLVATVVVTSFPTQVWWARWVPQLWLLALAPLVIIAGGGRPGGKVARALAGFSVVVLVANLGLIILYYGIGMVRAQRILDSQLSLLQKIPQPVSLFVPRFIANQFWLQDAGIELEIVGEKPEVPRMKIVKTTSWVGLKPGWREKSSGPEFLQELRKRDLLEE